MVLSDSSRPAPDKLRVLVVDDNVGSTKLLARMLARLGEHEVQAAHDGPAALEAVARFRPHLVLLDIGLPCISGYEVADRLRQQPENTGLLVVALTGYDDEQDRQRALAAGFDEYLTKPASVEDLERLLTHPKLARANSEK